MSDDRDKSKIRNALDARRVSAASSVNSDLQFTYDSAKLKEENKYRLKGSAFPNDIKAFNWGACILSPIWGLFNNSFIACLSLAIGLVPYVGIILGIAFSLYCGIKGNEWAWTNKEWQDINEFHRVQRRWAIWAIGIELTILISLGLLAYFIIQSFGEYGSSSELQQILSTFGVY